MIIAESLLQNHVAGIFFIPKYGVNRAGHPFAVFLGRNAHRLKFVCNCDFPQPTKVVRKYHPYNFCFLLINDQSTVQQFITENSQVTWSSFLKILSNAPLNIFACRKAFFLSSYSIYDTIQRFSEIPLKSIGNRQIVSEIIFACLLHYYFPSAINPKGQVMPAATIIMDLLSWLHTKGRHQSTFYL